MARVIRDKRKVLAPKEITFIDLSKQTEANMNEINKFYNDSDVYMATCHLGEDRNKFFRFQLGSKVLGAINLLEQDGDWYIIPHVNDENIHHLEQMTELALKKVKASQGHLTVIEPTDILIESLVANGYTHQGSYFTNEVRKDIFSYII
jgi:Mg2+ and Co2+ transporter CorA